MGKLQVIEHNNRFALARWHESSGQWIAPMTVEAKKLTGCSSVSGNRQQIVTSPNVATYPTKFAAGLALEVWLENA